MNKKKISSLFLAIIFMLSSVMTTFAIEKIDDIILYPEVANTEVTNFEENINTFFLPNGIPMSITANSDRTGCKVKVGNLGIDKLDKVIVSVKATGHSKVYKQEAKINPIVGKTFSFNIPMIKSSTTYNVEVKIIDGKKIKTKTGKAKIEYTESSLNGKWNRGSSYSSRAHSLEDHFKRHGKEVGSTNIVNYINKALKYRSDVSKSLTNIKKTPGTGSIPSTKYKNTVDGRYIILANSNKEIFSFGK